MRDFGLLPRCHMRYPLFRDVTDVSGQRPYVIGLLDPSRWGRQVVTETFRNNYQLRCVRSKKGEDIMVIAKPCKSLVLV